MKSEIIHLTISDADIVEASELRSGEESVNKKLTPACPVAVALKRATNTVWKTLDDSLVMENEAPFRIGLLPLNLRSQLLHFEKTGAMEAGTYVIMLDRGTESNAKPTY